MMADALPSMPQLIGWLMIALVALQFVSGGRSRRQRKLQRGRTVVMAEPAPSFRASMPTFTPELERKALLTKPELRFWAVLRSALPGHLIAPQVAMGALLRPRADRYSKGFLAMRGHFSQKIVDFAVIDPGSGEVLAIVELDDASHDRARDEARDAMLAQGDYPVIRFANRPWPTHDDVCRRMGWLIESTANVAPAWRRASP